MKRLVSYLIISYLIISFLGSCSHNPSNYGESPTTGNIKITVDESFKSIIDDEINVFEKIYIYAKIRPVYKPETQTYNDLLKDSVNLIVASRKLNAEENKFFESRKFFPKETKIAVDGIAIITNNDNNDSLISVNSLKKIFLGEIKSWKQLNKRSKLDAIKVVFDNTNSSTVRYVIDSITHNSKLSPDLSALKYTPDVVEFISRNAEAIGIIGVSWVSDRTDSTTMTFLKKVKVMYVSRSEQPTIDNSYQPYQAYIAKRLYPLTRDIYVINIDPKNGLAGGFAAFLASDRGQRIILKAGILPATQPVRIVELNNNF